MSNDEQKYSRELATKLAPDIEFLRKQWKRFCDMVEDHGAHFVKCATDPRLQYDCKAEKRLKKEWDELYRKGCEVYSDQKKAIAAGNKKEAARHKKALLKIEAQLKLSFDVPPPEPGCTLYWGFSPNKEYGYMDFPDIPIKGRRKSLPLYFRHFWITPGPVNPLPWLLESDPVDLSDEEQLIYNCVILSVAHDEGGQLHGPDKRVYRRVKKYEERYFKRDTFCQDLWGGLIHDQERVKRAYDCVKPHLDEWRKQPTQAKKQKRGSAAKKKAKKKRTKSKSKAKKKKPEKTSNADAYIPFKDAIELSNGVLTRKKLEKATKKGEPLKVRYKKPSPQRSNVHIQDTLALIKELSSSDDVTEKAIAMFSRLREVDQERQRASINLD